MTYLKFAQQNIVQRSAVAIGVILALFLAFGFAQTVSAHEDPLGCFSNGVGLSITVYRSDGTTPVGGGTVTPGETINYEATLSHLGGSNCNFDGGDLTITTPDGTPHVVASGAGIPLVTSGSPFVAPQQSYVVDAADVGGGFLTALVDYDNGDSHTPNQHQTASAGVDIATPFEKLDPDPVTEVHDDGHSDVTDTVITAGTEIHDMVAVGGGNGLTPTGNVDFELYDNLTCDGQLLGTEAGVGLDGSGEAESTPITPDPGEYSYLVHYNGDDNFNEGTAECEPFTIVDSLVVEKTVNESFDREWTWEITKSADQDSLELAEGEAPVDVNYTVEVDATSNDVNHEVTGIITVTNPDGNPDATVESVSDTLDVSGAASVSCEDEDADTTAPWTLSGGEVLTCTYEKLDADPDDSENEASVEVSGDVPAGDPAVEPVSFDEGDLDEETDECIDVDDTNVGFLGTVCADSAPAQFDYTISFGNHQDADVFVECGETNHPNTADFVTNDTGTPGDDDWNVLITVDCFEGCTLTQGYWKTHSSYGPAPEDQGPAWPAVGGPGAVFHPSGQTWHEVFWTPPKGNAYYNLAHQYMAAVLNVENGASVPGNVQDALDAAEALFLANSPDDVVTNATNKHGKTIGKKETFDAELAAEMKELAGILGSYNEGDIGPGHCDEDDFSDVD